MKIDLIDHTFGPQNHRKLRFSALKIWIATPKMKVVGSHGIHITRSDHSSSNTFLANTMQHVKAKCETVIAWHAWPKSNKWVPKW